MMITKIISTILVMAMLTTITMVGGEDYINVALGKPAIQKDDYDGNYPNENARRAVDGNHNRYYWAYTCTATKENSVPTWWMVDLLGQYKVVAVTLTNRATSQERLQQFSVYVSTTNPQKHPGFPSSLPGQQCFYYGSIIYGTETIPCTSPVYGRYLILYKAANSVLTLCEVEVLTERSVRNTQLRLLHTNTRSSHSVLLSASGISTALRCGTVCMKTSGGPATLLQHHKQSQLCECIRFSEFDTSDYRIISDMGWNLYSVTNN